MQQNLENDSINDMPRVSDVSFWDKRILTGTYGDVTSAFTRTPGRQCFIICEGAGKSPGGLDD
jgi:hypothetical protein